MLFLKTVTMPSKDDDPAIAKPREEMPSGPDALLILIVLISAMSLLMLTSKSCTVGVTLYMN